MTNALEFQNGGPDLRLEVTLSGFIHLVWFPISVQQYLSQIFSYMCHEPLVSQETASSSAECSRDKPPFSFVRGQDSTMCDTIAPLQIMCL